MTRAKSSVFIATSLDGFIASKDGSLDWLDLANSSAPPGQDCGYAAFYEGVDTLVMGRNSFEKVLTFAPWPYTGKRVIVLSSREVDIPEQLSADVSASKESPSELVRRLTTEGSKHLYVDGGVTIQSFLRERLIDEITITQVPVLIGEGRSLFGPVGLPIWLKHLRTKSYDFGYVQSTYAVIY